MARRSDLAGLFFVLTSIRMNARRARQTRQWIFSHVCRCRASQTSMRMCQSVLGNPNCKEARATGESSLFIVIIFVWTRIDGYTRQQEQTDDIARDKASNAKTHEIDGDTAPPNAAGSSTQGMGVRTLHRL